MTIEERITRLEVKNEQLENLVNALVKSRALDKMYTDADINGTRQSVANITPITLTKTAYIDDTEVVFTNVPKGNLSVYAENLAYRIERTADMVRISFEALSEMKNITISIL